MGLKITKEDWDRLRADAESNLRSASAWDQYGQPMIINREGYLNAKRKLDELENMKSAGMVEG